MSHASPGFSAEITDAPKQVWWSGPGGQHQRTQRKMTIDSTAVDAGNTPTTTLRAGNLIAVADGGTNGFVYDPDGLDGKDVVVGVLEESISMLDGTGVAEAKSGRPVMTGGLVKTAELIGLDDAARATMVRSGFKFDTNVPDGAAFLLHSHRTLPKTGTAYTVVAADNGALFLAMGTGGYNFTLPTIAAGLSFEFLNILAVTNMVITSAAGDDIVALGNAAADTITFDTATEIIGAHCRVRAVFQATTTPKWVTEILAGTATIAG